MNQEKSGQLYTFCRKEGLIIYLAVLKKWAIRHAHPYYAIERVTRPHPHHSPETLKIADYMIKSVNEELKFARPLAATSTEFYFQTDPFKPNPIKKDIGKQCRP